MYILLVKELMLIPRGPSPVSRWDCPKALSKTEYEPNAVEKTPINANKRIVFSEFFFKNSSLLQRLGEDSDIYRWFCLYKKCIQGMIAPPYVPKFINRN